MLNKLTPFALGMLLAFPSWAQFEVGTGTKATPTAPDTIMPAGKIFVDRTTFPPSRVAHTEERIELACTGVINVAPCNTTSTVPLRTAAAANGGQFRVECALSHVAFDDPIVWPGQSGRTHLHQFFGNTSTRSQSDLANMATTGNSTCHGGTFNRSGYWTPPLVYHCELAADILAGCNPARNGQVIVATDSIFYYKSNASDTDIRGSDDGSWGGAPMQWPPAGFRMIGGSATNTAALPSHLSWFCVRGGADVGTYDHLPTAAEAVTAGGCDELKALVGFSDCWNGVDLDSPTHQGHVARHGVNGCDATVTDESGAVVSAVNYPIMFPGISVNIHFIIDDTELDFLRLASDLPKDEAIALGGNCTAIKNWCAGRSTHADWVNGWSTATLNPGAGGSWGMSITDAILQECFMINNNPATPVNSDCHGHLLGSPLADTRWWTLH
jgi:hypothetical protein